MAEIHKGDIGTIFLLTLRDGGTAVDVQTAGAGEKFIIFKKPSGEVVTQTAAIGGTAGTDGKIKYTSVAGDLNEVGYWEMQAQVELTGDGAGTFKSEIEGFLVKRNL